MSSAEKMRRKRERDRLAAEDAAQQERVRIAVAAEAVARLQRKRERDRTAAELAAQRDRILNPGEAAERDRIIEWLTGAQVTLLIY